MATPSTGRPRASGTSPTGLGTRADILAAGAALFCTDGFASTSTHALARAAGVRQASLYHYFSGKDAVLLELLLTTVQPSLDVAARLLTADESAEARLWALCFSDAQLLASGDDNIGSLYLLPEISGESFRPFHERRSELETTYRTLVVACGVPAESAPVGAQLVLALVENVILQRRRGATPGSTTWEQIADAALRVLDIDSERRAQARRDGARLIADGD